MKLVQTIKELQSELDALRSEGKTIGLVPTMGALHAGHASLVKRAVAENAVIHSRHRGVTILFTDILCEQVVSFSLFTALHFLHQIHIAQSRMLSTDTRCSQNLRQLDRSTITKYSRKPLFQFLMNDSGGQ